MARRRFGHRKRRSREEIAGIIGEYERSGLTQRDFAATWGVPLATLTGWLRRARRGRFIEVRTDGVAKTAAPDGVYAVELSAGVRIAVPAGFAPAELGALLAELKGAGCLP
jgi:transposase-like protein